MIGKEVSHYKILEKIGVGGMGEVYLAQDMRLGRNIALKFLPKNLMSDFTARERFKREARAAAALNHPNIITVHEIGEFEDLIYISMEYIEGENLAEKIDINKDSDKKNEIVPLNKKQLNEIVSILLEVCYGLERAHKVGIIHRDIKLENVIISNEGRIKILDFGLAKHGEGTELTEESCAMGTAYYISPEQLKGDEIDQRSDIWSLGVVMYAMVTRNLPFCGRTMMETIYSIINKEPQPVSELKDVIPTEFSRIINGCLQKKPSERYQQLTEVIKDLKRFKEGLYKKKSKLRKKNESLRFLSRLSPRITVSVMAVILLIALFFFTPITMKLKVKKFLGYSIVPNKKYTLMLPLTIKGEENPAIKAFSAGLWRTINRKLRCCEQFDENLVLIPLNKISRKKINSVSQAWNRSGVNLVIKGIVQRFDEQVHLNF
jgi:serine/threonine protein kinase